MKLKWNRSRDGFTETKCGRYRISPVYWGRVSPSEYKLEWSYGTYTLTRNTQSECKDAAQEIEGRE